MLHFSELTGVRAMIEAYPLEKAAEGYVACGAATKKSASS